MKRAILIDGNNLLFRSYYATAYSGSIMKNSKGFPTNALFGFVNMINKIINEESPEYIMVAFDIGKNFRHEKYESYKDGRIETPDDLKIQFPIAKKILGFLGIRYFELENYEADDIIGTFARMADEDKEYYATIVSSDKDLLQLISSDVDVKLLKQKDYILMNEETFFNNYGIKPIKMIDLKSLEGDKSDNIPGVRGIGEKTALSLLKEFNSLEEIYDNIDKVKGKTKDKLIEDKKSAFFSKELATIYKSVPINVKFEDIKRNKPDIESLHEIYEELEFFSFMKSDVVRKPENKSEITIVSGKLNVTGNFSFYLELDGANYHTSSIVGGSIFDGKALYYLDVNAIKENSKLLANVFCTYDLKKNIIALNKLGIKHKSKFDTLIAAYLLNYNVKDDIAYLSNTLGYKIAFYESIVNKKKILSEEEIINEICKKSKFIYETYEKYNNLLIDEELDKLFYEIEMPLIEVLSSMEIVGIKVSKDVLDELKDEVLIRIESISNKIYNYAGESFNISSPKQLGDILFDKLGLFTLKKKGKTGYSTAHDVLLKLKGSHPIIELILEHRELTKLLTTYLDGLSNYILEDGRIHTIFKQTIARTGRLSSIEPNLQNIPVRTEEGRRIRKVFLPDEDSVIMSSDYSQIELRILAHVSGCESLMEAFKTEDIHTKVAGDIFSVPLEAVTKSQRIAAKAVIFGIVYGISGFGLGENLDLPPKEAKKYIDKYLEMYPGVKSYMDNIVLSAKEKGYVRTLFNRKRIIDELKNTNYMIRQSGERIALNTPIQGSNADIIKKAMIDVYKELEKRKLKSKMIIQVHDELIFNVVNDEIDEVKELVTHLMENVYKLVVPIKVEVDYGNNWYEAK